MAFFSALKERGYQWGISREKVIDPVIELQARDQYASVLRKLDGGDFDMGKLKDFDNKHKIAYVVFEAEGFWSRKAWTLYPAVPVPYAEIRVLK
jgi:hypothetical protein